MGPWKKFESTVVRLKRSYEDTGSVVCLTTKGRQLERNFEELKPASHVTTHKKPVAEGDIEKLYSSGFFNTDV